MVRRLTTAAGILALAVAATGAWLGQVVWGVGWEGLAWVSLVQGPETLPSCLLVALAVAVPWIGQVRERPLRGALLVGSLTGLGFGVYQGVAPLLSAFFHPRALMFLPSEQILQALVISLVVVITLGTGFSLVCWSLLRSLIGPIRWWGLLLFPLALLLVVPATWALVQLLPAQNGAHDFVHAVKMGYPPGCTALLLGLASWWARPSDSDGRTRT